MSLLQRLLNQKVRDHKFEAGDGIVRFDNGVILASIYSFARNGGPEELAPNLVPTEGLNTWINVLLGDATKIPTWYIAPFAGNVTPQSSWTAANFDSNATEFRNYTEANRQENVLPASATAGAINNLSSRAVFTIDDGVTFNQDTIWGAATLSSSTKGGTGGFLLSATRAANAKTNLVEGEQISIGFSLSLSDNS